jgi:S-adenosylmethionine hydrolase
MKFIQYIISALLITAYVSSLAQNKIVVMQSDFGLKDGAVAAMKGVAVGVSPDLKIYDITHEVPAYNIWEAAYRLNQTAVYWPAGTVFVSVVDPGVGSDRRSVVMKSRSGHLFVTPDNGTLTLVAETLGIEEVRLIDESKNRLKNSNESYTFHGRDVYAYTAARLAAGVITLQEVGEKLSGNIVKLPYQKATLSNGVLKGTIDILDVQYGNIWSNIPQALIDQAGIRYGDVVRVAIFQNTKMVFEGSIKFDRTFSAVSQGQSVAYLNSLLNFSIAINRGNFASQFKIASGPDWVITVSK